MRTPAPFALLLLLAAPGLLCPPGVFAESSDAAKLEAFRGKIKAIQAQLDEVRGRRNEAEQALAQAEAKIAELANTLAGLKNQLRQDQRRLEELQRQKKVRGAELAGQREALGRYVRAAYITGQQEYIKILLNQEDPALVGRSLAYYDIFSRARAADLARIRINLAELERLQTSIEETTATREKRLGEIRRNKHTLEQQQAERQTLIAGLDAEIREKGHDLARLRQDEQRLAALIGSLRGLDAPGGTHRPFFEIKGKLIWPVDGRITARYGSPRAGRQLKWQGILFHAEEGKAVRAIAPGRIIFADWMRGYGFVLIIDHGDGYMSLYGHNQRIVKPLGDWVEANDVIANVGSSGGRSSPGLYFEIRHNGRATNPLPWLAAKSR